MPPVLVFLASLAALTIAERYLTVSARKLGIPAAFLALCVRLLTR